MAAKVADRSKTVIAVFNQKGGVGKTTTALNLLAAMNQAGYNPVGIDLDPQAHLSSIMSVAPYLADESAYSFFMRNRPLEEIAQVSKNGPRIVPSHFDLTKLHTLLGKGLNSVTRLRNGVNDWAVSGTPVIIDCCPLVGVLSLNALFASDVLLVPVSADFLALQGAKQVERTVTALEHVFKQRLPRRYLLTRFDIRRRMSASVAEQLEEAFGPTDVCRVRISENVSLAESPAHHLDIFAHAPRSSGARHYQMLLEELVEAGFAGPQDSDRLLARESRLAAD